MGQGVGKENRADGGARLGYVLEAWEKTSREVVSLGALFTMVGR